MLEAAVALFEERGFMGATADDIAARAGVTKRTLYRHMTSKQHMLAEIHWNFLEAGRQRWSDVVAEGGTSEELLRRLIEEHVKVVEDFRSAIRVFFEEMKHLSGEDRLEVMAQRVAYQQIMIDVIRRGQDEGVFAAGDPEVTCFVILGALNEGYRWYEAVGETSGDRQLGSFVADLLAHGLVGMTAMSRT